jgi:protein phosphatase
MSEQSSVDTVVSLQPDSSAEFSPQSASSRVQVDLAGLSHPGKIRPRNEDHFLVARLERSLQVLRTSLPTGSLPDRAVETIYALLVADGMGGRAAGEIASGQAIMALVELVLQTPDWIMRLSPKRALTVSQRMEERFQRVKEGLVRCAQWNPRLCGMGTTLTVAASLGADMLICHVGDCRVYLLRQGQLQRLTRDQTLVQGFVDAGTLRPEEAARHPLRHVLTDVLSSTETNTRVALEWVRLADGDQVLVCSDGLTEMVPDAAIGQVLQQTGTAQNVCQTLIDRALAAGGKDNVTVIVARYRFPEQSS